MSSSLTFQLRQQQQKLAPSGSDNSLPSPPNSSYGDEAAAAAAVSNEVCNGSGASKDKDQNDVNVRRDSLPAVFNALTLQQYSTSLPENYTIDHSSPIPIQSTTRKSSQRTESSSPYSHSQHHHHHHHLLSTTATAAATGGRTIRNGTMRRSAEPAAASSLPASHGRKGRYMSESPGKGYHRCEECGKVYKHPNCLSKHRWEHSEQWELTSKLLLTKHQQVQMLEAAAILLSMDAQRVEQLQQRDRQDQQQQKDDDDDDDDNESIHVDDDDDDDDLVDMEMEPTPSNTSSPSLLPTSFPHGDD
ncbi:hypothetical protein VTP01DRAFT_4712 [Rhizomucor pusillus]|uniref:uncharacterized protein n=1 Tax=Rhizomucor pusillus TaxID=4840 RepID=UPI003742254D